MEIISRSKMLNKTLKRAHFWKNTFWHNNFLTLIEKQPDKKYFLRMRLLNNKILISVVCFSRSMKYNVAKMIRLSVITSYRIRNAMFLFILFVSFNLTSSRFREFYAKMVFCFQNCSDLLWEKIVLVIEKNFRNLRLKAENLQNFWGH